MVKAIIFDLGGVIYRHPKNVIPYVLGQIFKVEHQQMTDTYKKYRHDYYLKNQLSTDELIIRLKKTYPTNLTIDQIKKLWLEIYKKKAVVDSGMLKLLIKLKPEYRLYLFTNTTPMSDKYNRTSGIYDYFDKVFLSFKIGYAKPQSQSYRFVVYNIGLKPDKCLFIDDKKENIETADKLGFKTILFDINKENLLELEKKILSL